MASRKALLIAAAAAMAVVMGALLPATARPGNHVVGEQKLWSGDHIHEVGDIDGWTLGPNYDDWARHNNPIAVGDTLHFRYDRNSHNVLQVDEDSYTNCIVPNNAAGTWNSGDDFLELSNAGEYFFICGMGNHCANGMRLAMTAL